MATEGYLQRAFACYEAGDPQEAVRFAESVLRIEPQNGHALHLLGIIQWQQGNLPLAAQYLQNASRAMPTDTQLLSNLGRVYADLGHADQAIACYQSLVQYSPADPGSWFTLAVAYRTFGRHAEAIRALQKSASLAPGAVEPIYELGCIYRKENKLTEAEACFRNALRLRPNFAEAFHSLGNLIKDRGDGIAAIQHYRQAVAIAPQNPMFNLDLAKTLSSSLCFPEAVAAFEQLLALDPDSIDGWLGYALALSDLGQYPAAVAACGEVKRRSPDRIEIAETLGEIHLAEGKHALAVEDFTSSVERDPKRVAGWLGLGQANTFLGNFDKAAQAFRKALEIEPGNSAALKGLMVAPQALSMEEAHRLTEIIQNSRLQPQDRISAGFALGKLYDDADRFDDAFVAYDQANSAVRQLRASEGFSFDPLRLSDSVDQHIEHFTSDFFKARQGAGNGSDVPVFIVGMPRSGTTLVEQICSSHSNVFGAGELSDIGNYQTQIVQAFPHAAPRDWPVDFLADIANKHLGHLQSKSPASLRVVDKTPGNVFNLGLITLLFPNARIILCDRDPRDTCLSCYFQWFAKNNLMFSYDLSHCGVQYVQQQRLIRHWDQVLPLRMIHVQYEQLVAEPEQQSRRIIDFLGLPWEEKCLEFYKTERSVQTASVWQVRQPMYSKSVGRWKNYARHLSPLLQALQMAPMS